MQSGRADDSGNLAEFNDWNLELGQSEAKAICNAILLPDDASTSIALAEQDHGPTVFPVKIIR